MDQIQRGILLLIKSAITGQSYVLPEGFHMAEAEELIKIHQVGGMVYEGAVCCGISKQDPVMQKLFRTYYHHVLYNEMQMAVLDRIYQAFEENGIDYMPVKGCELKKMYPNAAMRVMGDADILIRMEQYDRIREILESFGYQEKEESDHNFVWMADRFVLEIHRRLIPTYDPDYYSYIGSGWERAHLVEGYRYAQSREDMYIFLFVHMTKHYRAGGIGLRQLVDLWLYERTGTPLDREYIRQEMAKIKLEEFYENILRLLDYWFHDGPADEKTEYISDFLFDSGSFGKKETRKLYVQYRESKKAGSVRAGKFKTFMEMIFPGPKFLSQRYPVLEKAPWLTPFLWPVRWVSAVIFRRDNIEQCQERLNEFTVDRIETFEDSLKYVGLDYRCVQTESKA